MSGHSKWKEIKRKGNGFISSNEYEVGQIIDLRASRGFPEDIIHSRIVTELLGGVPHEILSKECYPQYGSCPQWRYEVARLPENPMTEEDMEDISS